VFSTGGTIASVPGGGQGAAPTLTAVDLVAAVPQLADVADVTAVLFRQVASTDLDLNDMISLVRCRAWAAHLIMPPRLPDPQGCDRTANCRRPNGDDTHGGVIGGCRSACEIAMRASSGVSRRLARPPTSYRHRMSPAGRHSA
jgi:Asparaginase, N-terminal